MNLPVKIIGEGVLIKRETPSSVSASGIVLPSGKTNIGEVIEASDKCTLVKGDKVIFDKDEGITVHYKDQEYLYLKESQVWATVG